jgi:hypothetical protein
MLVVTDSAAQPETSNTRSVLFRPGLMLSALCVGPPGVPSSMNVRLAACVSARLSAIRRTQLLISDASCASLRHN